MRVCFYIDPESGLPHVYSHGVDESDRHEVPDPVYDLLREVGRRAPRPLTVILERDGAYPPVGRLRDELDRARAALAEGRRVA